jgi:hypothetical protein
VKGIHVQTSDLCDFGDDYMPSVCREAPANRRIAHGTFICEPNDRQFSPLKQVFPNGVGVRSPRRFSSPL